MVEGGDVAGERQHGVGEAEIVVGHVGEVLDLSHHVVPEVADDAAVERWKLRDRRCPVPRQQRLDGRERPLVRRDAGGEHTIDLDVAPANDERARRVAPEEREPPPPLGVLDRLEEESRSAVGVGTDELHERRDGRLEVSEDLAPHRDDGVIASERAEVVARGPDRPGRAHRGPGSEPSPNARKKQERSPVWQAPRPSCCTTKSSTSPSQS